MRKNIPGVLAVLALVAACVIVYWPMPEAQATPDQESYKQLTAAPTLRVTAAAVGDAVTTTVISARQRACNGNPSVYVSVDFSGAPGDTCLIKCYLYTRGTFHGEQASTVTAGTTTDGGRFVAPQLIFDLGSAETYEIRHATPSAGNVSIRWWTGSSNPE